MCPVVASFALFIACLVFIPCVCSLLKNDDKKEI